MYEAFFELHRRPFTAAPLASRYFPASAVEAARVSLSRCIERAEGTGLLVGPSGTGKTLLCHVLAEQFKDQFQVVFLVNSHLTTRRALLQVILFELGLPYRQMEEGELRLLLIDHLSRSPDCPHGMLLLIDEAHSLPLRLLEEVRMITNLVRNGQPRVRLVLAGGPSLEERLASPKLDSFTQRLTARCYLDSFNRTETSDYVRHQFAAAGGRAERILSADAWEAIYRATDGIPRLINQVCDHALMLAYANDRKVLDAGVVEEAWADLQQLPAPWTSPAAPATHAVGEDGVIQFGNLDDDLAAAEQLLDEQLQEPIAATQDEFAAEEPVDEAFEPAVVEPIAEVVLAEAPVVDEPTVFDDGLELAATFDDDFEPVGCIGPEFSYAVEDDFDAADEVFEEELLVDPYAMLDARAELAIAEVPATPAQVNVVADAAAPSVLESAAPHAEEEEIEIIFDPYAALDARKQGSFLGGLSGAGGSPGQHSSTETASQNWLERLPRVTERTAEETLTLAEQLLLSEMAPPSPIEPPVSNEQPETASSEVSRRRPADVSTAAVEEPRHLEASIPFPVPVAETTSTESPAAVDATPTKQEDEVSGPPVAELPAVDNAPQQDESRDVSAPETVDPVAEEAPRMLPFMADVQTPAEVEDNDLIVVEDSHEPVPTPVFPVRRHEYRQLFAKLRRGEV